MRLALGAIMVAHGYHKVFGGLHHHAQMVASLGLPAWLGYVSAFTEFFGGLLILAGFFTRVAAFAVLIDLFVAIWKVHLHNGLIGTPDRPGYEFALAARVSEWESIEASLTQLNSGAVEIMISKSPMRLHPNGLAVASHRHQR